MIPTGNLYEYEFDTLPVYVQNKESEHLSFTQLRNHIFVGYRNIKTKTCRLTYL